MQSNLNIKVRKIIAAHLGVDATRVTDDARFRDDLGADWLDRLEVIIAIEDQVSGFELTDVAADQIDTVGDLMRAIAGGPRNHGAGALASSPVRATMAGREGAAFDR